MENERSLNASLDSAKKHYSSMFSLPSLKKALFAVGITCIAGVNIVDFVLFPSITSLLLGFSLFAVTLLADSAISQLVLKRDPIFTMRRTLVLSLVGWLFWFVLLSLGAGLSLWLGWLVWIKCSLLGYAVVLTLRVMVFTATANLAQWRQLVSIFLQPTLCILAFLVFWISISSISFLQVFLFVILAPIISYTSVYLILNSIERLGKSKYSLSSLSLFKAFLLNWVTDLNQPLEKYLEEMGEDTNIKVSLLKFDSSKPKAAILLPLVHPGPFKNIGSSLLPSILKHRFEKEFNCDACVPLGILGHELDLASQTQNYKIVSHIIASANFSATKAFASQSVRVQEGVANVICQLFGDTVLASFSLAPKTTEDLPQELGNIVSAEAKKYGLKHAIVINAHNSLNDVIDTEDNVFALQVAASKCLQKVASLPTSPFMVGSATVYAKEFTLKQGMGAGGITALSFEVDKQKTVYVVIDGNNMISGLREKILEHLVSLGFDQSEVFTTDTHSVSALVTGRRGYHPIGEIMDQDVLLRYIGEAAKKAKDNFEAAKVGYKSFTVPRVRVIGTEHLNSISTLVDKSIAKAKQMAIPIFGFESLILLLLLLLF